DLERWLELVNQFQYWQDDVEALRFDDTLRPAGEPVLRLAAWAPDGGLAGVAAAVLSEDGSRHTDRAMGLVGVAPAYRRQSLGSRLAEEVERFAASNACRWVEAEVRERNLPVALPFIGLRSCSMGSLSLGRVSGSWASHTSRGGRTGMRKSATPASCATTAVAGSRAP